MEILEYRARVTLLCYISLLVVSLCSPFHCGSLSILPSQAVSPDGEAIVTGAGDETLRFWNVFSKTRCTKVQYMCHDVDNDVTMALLRSHFKSVHFTIPEVIILLIETGNWGFKSNHKSISQLKENELPAILIPDYLFQSFVRKNVKHLLVTASQMH